VEQLLVLLAERDALIVALTAKVAGVGCAGRGVRSPVGEELAELLEAAELGCVREATATVVAPGLRA